MKTNLQISKQRHQVKSRWYYIFWGSATLSVFAGQLYVGSGYRQMSKSFNRLLNEPIVIMEENYRTPYEDSPMVVPRYNGDFVNPEKSLGILY